jgi:hypothetical protein
MALERGTQLGPDTGTPRVKTTRDGVAGAAGHDLVLDVARWKAPIGVAETLRISVHAKGNSLRVLSGSGGAKPLTDADNAKIEKSINDKVLRGQAISFRSDTVQITEDGGRVNVRGQLSLVGSTQAVSFPMSIRGDGSASASASVTQSSFGIKPFTAMLGALKVGDKVEIVFEGKLPVS